MLLCSRVFLGVGRGRKYSKTSGGGGCITVNILKVIHFQQLNLMACKLYHNKAVKMFWELVISFI